MEAEDKLFTYNQHFFFHLVGSTTMLEEYRGQDYSFIRNRKGFRVPIWPSFFLFNIGTENPRSVIRKATKKEIPWQVWIENDRKNCETIKILEDSNFKRIAAYLGMFTEIDILAPSNTPDVEILKVGTEKELPDWAKLIAHHWWQGDGQTEDALFQVYRELYRNQNVALFVAYYHRIPAGTSLGVLDGGSVGLYLIYTKPLFRKKGIGRMLTEAPLLWGKEKGYGHAALYATDEGKGLYDAMGFKPVFYSYIYLLDQ